jgi:hypothetical protein
MLGIAQAVDMGRAARQRAVERFGIAHWIGRHRQVFTELLAARRVL